jgi:DNA-binding NarL/FixJ family response regulator
LERILAGDMHVRVLAREVDDDALEFVLARHSPAVAIVDESFKLALLERLTHRHPATSVAVFAYSPTPPHGLQYLACGLSCLAQGASAASVRDAVHAIAEGNRLFIAADGHHVERRPPDAAPSLTARETEVLRHLSKDARYAEIAQALRISPETVRSHAASIRRKLNAGSRRELIGTPVPTAPVVGDRED